MLPRVDRPIATALIGLGNSGRHYHLPHLIRDDRYALRVVATERPAPSPVPGVPVVSGWEAALDHDDIELVVIATPHHLHHPIAAAAVDRGIHVLVEKPMTSTLAEADDLCARALRTGALLTVHHQRRWEEDFLALREIVRSGEIGTPWRIAATRGHQGDYMTSTADRPHVGGAPLAWARERASGGGVLRIIGPHPIDHVLQLAPSNPVSVSARVSITAGEHVERWAGLEIDFGAGVSGRVDIFRHLGSSAPRFAVWGDAGMAVAPTGDRIDVVLHDGTRRTVGGLNMPSILGAEIYEDVASALRGGDATQGGAAEGDATQGGSLPRVTVAQAREVVRVIELAERSAAMSGAPQGDAA